MMHFVLEASFNLACGVWSRSSKRSRNIVYNLGKIKNRTGLVIGVINATEPEPEESERFRFLPTLLNIIWLRRLRSRENQIVGVGRRNECSYPHCVCLSSSASTPWKGFVLKS